MSEPAQSGSAAAAAQSGGIPGSQRSVARRLGCRLLIACWFVILLTPCGLFYLAANGEIRLEHRQIPEPYAHPFLLIALVSESDDRGLRIERSAVRLAESAEALCVETSVTFLLWRNSGGNQDAQFCDCYRRPNEDSAWDLISTNGSACVDAG